MLASPLQMLKTPGSNGYLLVNDMANFLLSLSPWHRLQPGSIAYRAPASTSAQTTEEVLGGYTFHVGRFLKVVVWTGPVGLVLPPAALNDEAGGDEGEDAGQGDGETDEDDVDDAEMTTCGMSVLGYKSVGSYRTYLGSCT